MIKYFFLLTLISCQSMNSSKSNNLVINKFFYQLQNYGEVFEKNISTGENNLWVVDSNKKENTPFSPYDILAYSDRNTVFSYLSVGEAESYRNYFKHLDKSIILYPNSNWKNNFIIKYWDIKWENTLKERLDNILKQGFQGVFLDVVDVYQRFDHKEAPKQMAYLIINLSKMAKSKNKNFKINLQNGFEIITKLDQETKESLISAIDGLSVEAHYFDYNKKKIIKNKWFYETEDVLKQYKEHNKTIYMIEYTKNKEQQLELKEYCTKHNIHLLITDKNLTGKFFIHEK